MTRRFFLAALLAFPLMASAQGAKVYAAGSLRAALEDASSAFSAYRAGAVAFEFGPSGILRDRLMKGEAADVFASANMEHPGTLAKAGKAGAAKVFARDRVCALSRAKLGVTPGNLLDRMLDPEVKLGTSTPETDPAGEYARRVFERAEKVRPGAYDQLSKKALQLVPGGQADIFLTDCTNATLARMQESGLEITQLPESLAVGVDYGLVTLNGASPTGHAFVNFLLGPEGRRILALRGFALP